VTFLEGILEPAALTRSDLASVIKIGINQGLSGNTMLSTAQALGVGIRRVDFLQLVGEVRSSIAGETAIQALSLTQAADESMVTQWEGGATNTFLHRVTLYVREGPPGVKEVMTHNFDILSDRIMTAQEATSQAQDIFNEGLSTDNYSDQELLGSELRNIFHQTGAG
jgi:hypothetical protein